MLIRTSKELGNFPAPTAAHSLRRTLSLTHKLRQDTLVHHALTNMHIVTHTDTHILTLRHTQTQTVTRRHAGWVGIANGCPFFPKKVFSRLNRPLLQALPGEARERETWASGKAWKLPLSRARERWPPPLWLGPESPLPFVPAFPGNPKGYI